MASASDIALVRTLLPGVPATVTDAQIGGLLDAPMAVIDVAIALADSMASLYANKVNIRVGSISINNSDIAKSWQSLKRNLIFRKQTDSGVPGASGASIGGAGVAVMSGGQIPRKFVDGQLDNPPCLDRGLP
ncbi:hypothetical protein HDG34_005868 [Paraburkholderia sp. HC6.4b]|uniref:hypothetical protein n=1 Tax=unclassified Paraburkholderia TaxID=2615204 RepID=UPI00160AA6AE|nr:MULTISPECIES: hypothetical protein [unclassified Paraburkholderia]MBB5411902.1 hypothetical protein [Paraburkholderia sp. HC6.4b]MBB5450214.1 hypothetical protein [Paraburkholderia sp. Kb1A]